MSSTEEEATVLIEPSLKSGIQIPKIGIRLQYGHQTSEVDADISSSPVSPPETTHTDVFRPAKLTLIFPVEVFERSPQYRAWKIESTKSGYRLHIKFFLVVLHQDYDAGLWKVAYSQPNTSYDNFLKLVTWENVSAWQGDEMRFYFIMRMNMNQRQQDLAFLSKHYGTTVVICASRNQPERILQLKVNEYQVPSVESDEEGPSKGSPGPDGPPLIRQRALWPPEEARPRTPIRPGTTNDQFWNLWQQSFHKSMEESGSRSEGACTEGPVTQSSFF